MKRGPPTRTAPPHAGKPDDPADAPGRFCSRTPRLTTRRTSLFRSTTHYVRPDDRPDAGKRRPSNPPGAVKRQKRSRKWYGKYRDADGILKTVPLAADKAAAKIMLRDFEIAADRGRSGLSDPFAAHAVRPLAEDPKDFRAELASRDNTEQHVEATAKRVKAALLTGCGFRLPGDTDAGRVSQYLSDRRAAGLGKATGNHYLTACKAFTGWMVKDGRADRDPLARLRRVNAKTEVRKERRAIADGDLADLLNAADNGPAFCGLPGPDRRVLYLAAAYTGFRASELASLTPQSFDFDADAPTVTVQAAYSKHRRRDVQPLPPALADVLRAFVAERVAAPDGGPTAPPWGNHGPNARRPCDRWRVGRAAEMLRADLDAAGIPYADGLGHDFDFHALRGQFIAGLVRSDAHPKDAQTAARHSTITLTMDRYAKTDRRQTAAAVNRLTLPTGVGRGKRANGRTAPGSAASVGTADTGDDHQADDPRPGGVVFAPVFAPADRDGRGLHGTTRRDAVDTSTSERHQPPPRQHRESLQETAPGDDTGRPGTPEQTAEPSAGGGTRTRTRAAFPGRPNSLATQIDLHTRPRIPAQDRTGHETRFRAAPRPTRRTAEDAGTSLPTAEAVRTGRGSAAGAHPTHAPVDRAEAARYGAVRRSPPCLVVRRVPPPGGPGRTPPAHDRPGRRRIGESGSAG